MAKLLYVRCNLKTPEHSRSLTLAAAFLQEYQRLNPDDQIEIVDVYRDNIQRIDDDVMAGWSALRAGAPFSTLTADQQRKVVRIAEVADQFVSADKYLISTPMWNLSFPAEMKIYIDSVCIVGKTFRYTAEGAVGLLRGKSRKCLHIHSNGGLHFGTAEDHSVPYLESIVRFMGIEDFHALVLEGTDAMPERAQELQAAAVAKAITAAASF